MKNFLKWLTIFLLIISVSANITMIVKYRSDLKENKNKISSLEKDYAELVETNKVITNKEAKTDLCIMDIQQKFRDMKLENATLQELKLITDAISEEKNRCIQRYK